MSFLYKLDFSNRVLRQSMSIVLVGIVVRIILFFLFDYSSTLHSGDSSYYLEVGKNIQLYGVHGKENQALFYRPPLYSFFAGFVANLSETAIFFYIVQSLFFILFSLGVYYQLSHYGNKIAFLSAMSIAASPFDALLNGRVLSENLVTPLLVFATLLFASKVKSKKNFFISGALIGAASLCRDIYILLPLFFLAAGIFAKLSLRNLMAFILGFSLLISPWIYRNSTLPSGGFFLSQGNIWPNLWVGTWEKTPNTNWHMTPKNIPIEASKTFNNGNSPEIIFEAWKNWDQKFFKNIVIEYVENHPTKVFFTMVSRHPGMWMGTRSDLFNAYTDDKTLSWYFLKISFYILNCAIIFLSFGGMIVAYRSLMVPMILLVPVIYTSIIYFPFHNGETRYSQPVIPILIIFCIFFILHCLDEFRARS